MAKSAAKSAVAAADSAGKAEKAAEVEKAEDLAAEKAAMEKLTAKD